MDKQVLPYGMWPSPITPTMLGLRLRLEDAQWDSDGQTLVWLERRSGRGVLVAKTGDEAPRDLTDELSVRAGVGYGGGDFTVRGGQAVFVSGGRLYRLPLRHGRPRPITPAFGDAAAPVISPDGARLLFVHTYERADVLALTDMTGRDWPRKLAQGADFYMQPVWHPDGERIAWIEWDHPQMPWDGARLQLARLAGDALGEVTLAAGDAETPVFQPAFSPDGRTLSYLVQDGEWDALRLLDLESGETRTLAAGGTLIAPAWVQGRRTYAWTFDSAAILYLRNENGFVALWRVDAASGKSKQIELPYTWLDQIAASPASAEAAFLASAPQMPDCVAVWDGERARPAARSGSESLAPEDLSAPRPITWQAPDGATVHGLYYPPASARHAGEGLPPAVIDIHGGPTSQKFARYNVTSRNDAAFFTSRGYAVLQVNYRGSTGYGRSYMLALRQKWGLLDVEDAVGGAQALAAQGLADPKRLVIKGGSAGGYTVLNALIRHAGFFKAGLCLFGVSNLFTLEMDTHKFEEDYNATLVGRLPEAAERFKAWSPIFHADKIRDAVAVFQGAEDVVVPPNQSESIVAALRANNVPHIYRLYEGEGHGWRKTETITRFYEDVEKFLQEHVLFA